MIDPIPVPGKLLIEMMLFCRSYPLARPRMNKHQSGVYQPLGNQALMRAEMVHYTPPEPFSQPMCLEARIFYTKPPFGTLPHVVRFDIDNCTKGILDNLQFTSIINDDCLIVRTDITKAYSSDDYLIVRLFEANPDEAEFESVSTDRAGCDY